ncbi:response regulator transcription factor [Desulfallas thermosapovorans]|uniref:Stage 0 sporulation protein A homolog n=1 Tax=Desulfallas thermosapovorans DSM 6562 TaxID=1121431 RepID=A0A5S4ZP02_9FIRM|nr:response regulator transcription factor [Desulfallas thermosapovorans]TYO93374.1 LuxR family two component transcriptional regulator [Desulfallas thermosapovorans DSM 6562]
MSKINIMLVEDHNIVRQGLKRLIEMEEGLSVTAEAGTCAEAMEKLNNNVDVVLLDIKLPDGDGLELCRVMSKSNPRLKFIALTTYDDAYFIRKALDCGVHGFIPKYASFEEIKSAIDITVRDGHYLYPGLGLDVIMKLPQTGLTDVETRVLQMIAAGETQKDVAASLFMSLSTLRRRIKGICTKLGVETVEEALAAAVKKGLIE